MNNIIAGIFKNKILNVHKLLKYGFTQSDGAYFYRTDIADGQFFLDVKISQTDVDTVVTEKEKGIDVTSILFLFP